MGIVTEISWDQIADPDFGITPARRAFRQALNDVVERAKAALPDSHSRIDKAVQIVLAGDVTMLPDGDSACGFPMQRPDDVSHYERAL